MENLFNKSYLVIGFKNRTRYATLNKEFATETEARRFIGKAMENKDYEVVVLREEKKYIGNNNSLDISTSNVMEKFVA